MTKLNCFKHELREHLPYTIFAVSIGIIIIGLLSFIAGLHTYAAHSFHDLYHIFHPLHLLFSASATTAMYLKYEKSLIKALLIALVGTIGVCGLSDIILPYAACYLLGITPELHICFIQHPVLVAPFIVTGIFLGFLACPHTHKSTIFAHASHVLVSSMASILYLVSFGLTHWMHDIGLVFIFVVISVIIPCCSSDIILPLMISKQRGKTLCT